MSMYRQLWLALILSTCIALAGSLLASTAGARIYLTEQLRMKNADNASALALSLSNKSIDTIEMELAVAALFDRGHYESIRITSPSGAVLIERIAPPTPLPVPDWFVRLLPIQTPAGEALISDGWKQVGKVQLLSHRRFAYEELWRTSVRMGLALLFAGLLGAYLGTLILRRLKRPLDTVIDQAHAICERRFVTIPEPSVPELRQLSSAMNSTVLRLKKMFSDEAARLEEVRREANVDHLTGIANRDYFMARLHAAVASEETGRGGLIILRVAHLAALNQKLGRHKTDELLKAVGDTMHALASRQREALAGRLNGADFGLLLMHADAMPIAHELLARISDKTALLLQDNPTAYIGVGALQHGSDVRALLTRIDMAVAQAEAGGVNAVCEAVNEDTPSSPLSAEQWAERIHTAFERDWIALGAFAVTDFNGRLLHRECPVRMKFSDDGEWMPAGRFLPMVERLGLTPRLDLAAVRLGLDALQTGASPVGLAINLSASSIRAPEFQTALLDLLRAAPLQAQRLWLEISERSALMQLPAFRTFCKDVSATGCRIGIEHFGRQFSQIGDLHDLGLHYLKVDASFIRGIDAHAGNQAFLKGMASISHTIGLQVIAEGVHTEEELLALSTLGFDGATGPAVRE